MQEFGKWMSAVIGLMVLALGCIGTNPVTPTRYYLLNPASYEAPLIQRETASVSVEIRSLRLPQYLEKPQIVTRSSQNRLELADYHQWAGNLRKNMSRVMARNLSYLLSTPNVSIAPFQHTAQPDVRIEAQVMAFEADSAGQVLLTVNWRLINGKSNKVIESGISDFTKKYSRSSKGDMEGIVSAMGEALGQFCLVLGEVIKTQDFMEMD